VRDVLHVADLCDLITEQMQNFETWDGWLGNVSSGLENSVSLCELTQMCREESGAEIVIGSVAETRPADLRVFIADCSRLLEKTSWRPRRKVGDIVRDTCAWAQDQREDLIRLG